MWPSGHYHFQSLQGGNTGLNFLSPMFSPMFSRFMFARDASKSPNLHGGDLAGRTLAAVSHDHAQSPRTNDESHNPFLPPSICPTSLRNRVWRSNFCFFRGDIRVDFSRVSSKQCMFDGNIHKKPPLFASCTLGVRQYTFPPTNPVRLCIADNLTLKC